MEGWGLGGVGRGRDVTTYRLRICSAKHVCASAATSMASFQPCRHTTVPPPKEIVLRV